ncbi:MAG: M48 family metallopeptidase [Haloplanus sp.]
MSSARGQSSRFLLAATGLATLAVYALFALLAYRGLQVLWASRPGPLETAVVTVGLTLVFGYLSYRLGTARIVSALDAVEIPRADAPRLYDRVEAFAADLGVETPTLLVARMDRPNALALGGPRDGAVVLDASLFRLLSAEELVAIVAHELAHLRGRDSLVKTLGYSLVQTATGLAWLAFLPVTLLAVGVARATAGLHGDDPLEVKRRVYAARAAVGSLVAVLFFGLTVFLQAYSRRREYAADDRAADLTGDPLALARGLARIHSVTTPGGALSPLLIDGDEEGGLSRLLATHPPMRERIGRLRRRAAESGVDEGRRVEVR